MRPLQPFFSDFPAGQLSRFRFFLLPFAALFLLFSFAACAVMDENEPYFGLTAPPAKNSVRYVSGPEPESLDPQVGTGQVEQRIYVGLFEGLVEYHPETLEPVPAIAERWEINPDSTVFTFFLRRTARWSKGEPITARDFVFSMRRGLDPKFASRGASQAYYIKNAKAFNEGALFVQDPASGEFLTDPKSKNRLTIPASEKERAAAFKAKPELEAAVAGKTLVPVKGEDLGVEAIDDYTVRITLEQSVPFFVKILPHNFFRFVPEKVIKEHGNKWTEPRNIVTSGAFTLKRWSPYHEIVLEKNPYYWDAADVGLDEIVFYPVEEITTVMNLYKAGEIDATYNRSVPRSWLPSISRKRDLQNEREASIEYYVINTTKPPMNDLRVRQAFSLAVNRNIIASTRPGSRSVTSLVPAGIFKDYPALQTEEFNPARAKALLAEAGFRDPAGNYDPSKFPIDEIALTFNTSEGNRFVAEIVQAQWKQNLGLTVPLKNMETKTFISHVMKLEYKGMARFGYAADYIDPYSLLSVFASEGGDNGTGWSNARYGELLDAANRTLDQTERYRLLTEAESLFLKEQPIIPLMTSTTNWLKKPYVKGMFPNPMTVHPWKFVYIERDPQKWDEKK